MYEKVDLDACQSLQSEEFEVLQSIYPDCISSDFTNGRIRLDIPVEFGCDKEVELKNDGTISNSTDEPVITLSALPHILLTVFLPPDYPLVNPPEIITIHATHSWLSLSHIRTIRENLLAMWLVGEGILYDWIEWIRSTEFLQSLKLTSPDGVVCIPHPAPHILSPLLVAHDLATQSALFALSSYYCNICLEAHKGARCIQLSCKHVFCRACLHDFWGLCITEGDVNRVGCPHVDCVKEGNEATEEDVRKVVNEDVLARWKWLKEKRILEKDPSIIHCPMPFCQTPVTKPVVNQSEDLGWVRLRTCPSCSFSFCAFCKRTWHGLRTHCKLTFSEPALLEYMALPPESTARQAIEQRFGQRTMARLVAEYQEDRANKKWLENSTMACPGCSVNVEKSMGCNHMQCARCQMHFCYRCGTKLISETPYIHFSTRGLSCFNRLFDVSSEEEREWQPIEAFEVV